jgi:MoaA/NifB/PqqE/SkfB family radical SAM enzyme
MLQLEEQHKAAQGPANLTQIQIAHDGVREALLQGRKAVAKNLAVQQLAGAFCDLALTLLANDEVEEGFKLLQQAQNLQPESQQVLHNIIAALLARKQLRGPNLQSVQTQLRKLWNRLGRPDQYRRLLYAPAFMNLEFVFGKCNLKCRMCLGGHDKGPAARLEYISTEDFEAALSVAPTVGAITLSSGDSDPLLHPRFEDIVDIAKRHNVLLNVYTNGLPLSARRCRKIVESGVFSLINFSIDAATPETYRRLRGEDLGRLLAKVEMLRSMMSECRADRPLLSLSFVAMADNIEELPAFVDLAARFHAYRVYVEDLIGWDDPDGPNKPATDHPRCQEFVRLAQEAAAGAALRLDLPSRLCAGPQPSDGPSAASAEQAAPSLPQDPEDRSASRLGCCTWIGGVWVQKDGRLDPCCLLHGVVDMGSVRDGPLLENDKYARVKEGLLSGKVLPECLNQRACQYVQQRLARGRPPEVFSPELVPA